MKVYKEVLNERGGTSQRIKSPGTIKNSAGGYVFKTDRWDRFDRFLILGTEESTYYIGKQKLTKQNAKNAIKCIKEDGIRAVNRIVEISESGRAANNDPALLLLALATHYGDEKTKRHAYQNLHKVARIGTHLFHFAEFRKLIAGWGSGMKRAVARWYQDKSIDELGYQVVKYRQRDGWSHRDILRLAHPTPKTSEEGNLFRWIVNGKTEGYLPRIVEGFLKAQTADSVKDVVSFIKEYDLPREALPTRFLNEKEVWEALLYSGRYGMPLNAMVRNLGKMSQIGLLTTGSDHTRFVISKLVDQEAIKGSRIHPVQVLFGMKTYSLGRGFRGSLAWAPVANIVAALEDTFYTSFGNVEPTNKRILLALDVSGSMSQALPNAPAVSCAMGAAAMAMVTARTEPLHGYDIVGFTRGSASGGYRTYGRNSSLSNLGITSKMSLNQIMKVTNLYTFGGTDCSLPMYDSIDNGNKYDAFVIYTDNETWAGTRGKPHQALNEYRRISGIPAKLIVVGMVANKFSIADPNDLGSLDVVGFDAGAPQIISDFIRG